MAAAVQLTCVSHGPALARPLPEPKEHAAVMAAYRARAEALQAFDPELIIMFAPDHYTNVHLSMVPPFAVALTAEAVADYGGYPGTLRVPTDLAWACVKALRSADFDIAVSHKMSVDHGFSQPLHWLAGSLDRYPVLPIFINTTCRPSAAFSRVRRLGEAVGAWAKTLNKRIAFVASGGLSHHPANVFPQDLSAAPAELADYLMSGGAGGGMARAEWLSALGEATKLGGERVAKGERVAADFRINPAWDHRFLELFTAGDFTAFDAFDPDQVVAEAGCAAMEVQQWIAAAAAAKASGGGTPKADLYVATVEYRIGVGVAHADPA
jgi:2,3-dihydroxyphenylpropionate 1,2-dioxygenase